MALLNSLIGVVFGVVISILAAAVLLPVTLFIAMTLRRVVDGRVADVIGGKLDFVDVDLDVGDKVETAIIGGIIGGIVFTSLSPAIAPAMHDLHVQSGIVDEPGPTVEVRELADVSDQAIVDQYNVTEETNYSVYVLDVRNEDQRTMRGFNLNVRFPGCVEATAVDATNLGAAIVSNESSEISMGEFDNKSINATCYGAVGVDEFPPGNAARVTFVVDDTPEGNEQRLYPEPTDTDDALVTDSYSWSYNDRTYYVPGDVETIAVDQRPASV